jgi:hypothetical protein
VDLKTAHPSNQQKTFLEPDTELLKKGIIRLAALKYDLPLNEHLGVTKRPLLIFFCFSFLHLKVNANYRSIQRLSLFLIQKSYLMTVY